MYTESTESVVKYSIVHFSEYTQVVDLSVLCLKHRKYCSDSTVPCYFFSRPYKEKEKKGSIYSYVIKRTIYRRIFLKQHNVGPSLRNANKEFAFRYIQRGGNKFLLQRWSHTATTMVAFAQSDFISLRPRRQLRTSHKSRDLPRLVTSIFLSTAL